MNDMIDRNRCKESADAFFDMACMIDNDPRYWEFKNEMLVPYVVNLMFACELYFKYLLMPYIDFSIKKNKIHRIKELYDWLQSNNPKAADKLMLFYNKSFGSSTSFHELIEVLNMYNNAFDEYRYIYETQDNKKLYSTEIAALARSLKRLADEES